MSKFSERLTNLGQTGPAKMGFGKAAARDKSPVMLVIGKGGDPAKDAGSVDLLLRDAGSKTNSDGDWGLIVDGSTEINAEQLVKDGCLFALIASDDASAEVLLAEDMARGLPVVDGLSEHRVRSIEDGPFDFLVYRPESITWPLTVGAVLLLQDLISSFSKHIFIELPANSGLPGEKDLEVLKNLPVSAIIVDLGSVKASDAASMKEAIAGLEPRKPSHKGDRSPLALSSGRTTSDDHGIDGDDFDEAEDSEWEDES